MKSAEGQEYGSIVPEEPGLFCYCNTDRIWSKIAHLQYTEWKVLDEVVMVAYIQYKEADIEQQAGYKPGLGQW